MDPLALLEQECLAQKSSSVKQEESLNVNQQPSDSDVSPHAPEICDSPESNLVKPEPPKVTKEFHYIKRDMLVPSDEEEVRKSSKVERHQKSRKYQHKRHETKATTSLEPVKSRKIVTEGLTAIERMILRREEALLRHSKEFVKEMKDLYKSDER